MWKLLFLNFKDKHEDAFCNDLLKYLLNLQAGKDLKFHHFSSICKLLRTTQELKIFMELIIVFKIISLAAGRPIRKVNKNSIFSYQSTSKFQHIKFQLDTRTEEMRYFSCLYFTAFFWYLPVSSLSSLLSEAINVEKLRLSFVCPICFCLHNNLLCMNVDRWGSKTFFHLLSRWKGVHKGKQTDDKETPDS